MSKVHPAEREATIEAIETVWPFDSRIPSGPWEARFNESSQKWEVHSAEPFMVRPSHNAPGAPRKRHTLVCTLSGGASSIAGDMARFIAATRGAMPILAARAWSAAGHPPLFQPDTHFNPADVPQMAPDDWQTPEKARHWEAFTRFLDRLADAVDDLIAASGNLDMALPRSDRNASPIARLTCYGDHARVLRSQILAAVADAIHPTFDEAKLRGLPPQDRVPARGRPSHQDIYAALPKEITQRGEPMRGSDENLAQLIADLEEAIARDPDRVQSVLDHQRESRAE